MFIRIMISGFLLLSSTFTFIIYIYTSKQDNNINRYFSFLNLCISIYSFGYAMEILYSGHINVMMFWNIIQYFGLPFIPAFWIIFTLEFNNIYPRFSTVLGIFIIPMLTIFFRLTSSINHLHYFSVQLLDVNKYFPVLYIEKGPWYWVHAFYVTICLIVSSYLYLVMFIKSAGPVHKQCFIMLVASFIPWISYLMNLFNTSPLSIDYGPFSLTFSVTLFLMAFLKFSFLNIKPMARDKIFESTHDGIIVLDTNYNIIDFNKSAADIFSVLNKNILGRNITIILKEFIGFVDSIKESDEFQYVSNKEDKESKSKVYYRVKKDKITKTNKAEVGLIITLTDITKFIDMMERLNLLATRDGLTGVYNKRYFVELSNMELEKSKRNNSPISLIILDLDFFKQINDKYGHLAGDIVLKKIAVVCNNSIRTTDILGRYGGEEFVITLPETKLSDCYSIANRILNNIREEEIIYDSNCIKVTASIGIAGVDFVTDESLDDLLKKADDELYRAKTEGRNCLCF